jgi:hypothetical protein
VSEFECVRERGRERETQSGGGGDKTTGCQYLDVQCYELNLADFVEGNDVEHHLLQLF